MKQETVTISKKEYDELLEEVGILRNSEMMEAIRESDKAIVDTIKGKKMFVGQTYGGGIIFYVDEYVNPFSQ